MPSDCVQCPLRAESEISCLHFTRPCEAKMQRWCVLLAFVSAAIAASVSHSPEIAVSNDQSTVDEPSASAISLTKTFDGCYSDTNSSVLELLAYKVEFTDNTNAKCARVCQEKGYAAASTQYETCYCGNDLPIPRLYAPDEDLAAGNGGPCSITCPGAYTSAPCRSDECCGGSSAYSVYVVGDIDVLEQLARRIIANFQDPALRERLLTAEELDLLHCRCFNGDISITVTGQSVNSNGYGHVKTLKLTRRVSGKEEIEEIDQPSNLEECYLDLRAMDKQIESREPIDEEPFSSWDIMCDNTQGASDSLCSKEYTESIGFSESWSTDHGFDLSATVGNEFTSSAIFVKATYKFELETGYSFTSGYVDTQSTERSETFAFSTTVPAGAKAEIRFFHSNMPVSLKWRATFASEGYILVDFGTILEKKFHLSEVMSYEQRLLYAFGILDYGERPTLIARTKVVDRDGNTISTDEQEKPGESDLE